MFRSRLNRFKLLSVALVSLIAIAVPIRSEVPVASAGLAQCAGLMHAMSDIVEGADQALLFEELASAWASAGIEKARQEGHFYPEYFVEAAMMSAADEWRRRSAREAFVSLLEQEMSLCDRLAEKDGLFRLAGAPG
ncbi:hypothetical protein JQU17_07915 [Ponticoccus sp. SC2-23]|uniref:hypothetical protein n=1 Tax=Alexandriicola marinus TaxID=2081710 RepID=UPI0013E0A473|nr:hypothetical protein [Alexandriicola marinus]MBM1233772.1 hypothetical protein [Ponticoccus sp. SC6-45]MBM1239092.1 hypothetical protein [Ponticoccus sp. SC6-49]MBM1242874.1 hypothetical protein [Ponticoccus sp. SC2-64]MBM1260785.1 hypothetical protein [Ponticoccus sp. SC6-31]MBM1265104.1 hypothetical protein [Ponticoccus sp. SC2-67]MBM1269747.1 hypothetical protein [Ponticoccus sp. SC2-37]MBM1283587.1 hypothetical protein [Ponticoccus sp. SC6-8]MBM1301591.1 hypothetical protein [Pontico